MALNPQKSITQYKHDTWQAALGLKQKAVLAIRQTPDNYIWLGTMNGLVRFDGISFKMFNKDNTRELQDNIIRVLEVDRKGNLWIGTESGGLSCLKHGTFKTYPLEKYPALKEIQAIFEDRKGTLWIGTLNSGLTALKNGKSTTYTKKDGLASNRVRAFHEDEEGCLWIGTDKGLSVRDPSGKFSDYIGKNGPFDKYIISMCKTTDGKLWIGCSPGLYYLKDGDIFYDESNKKLPNLKIKCLYEDTRQNLWIGTEGGGFARIKNGNTETFSSPNGAAQGYIYSIQEDSEENLWIGTLKEGLHRLRDTLFTPYTTREGLSHDTINCIGVEGKGSILIGTEQGLDRLKKSPLNRDWVIEQVVGSNRVTAVMEDRDGYLWIGTRTGLERYKDGKSKHFNEFKLDRQNYVLQLQEDQRGAVWILTKKNLSRFHKGEFNEFINIKEVAGISITSFRLGRQGTLWIGTFGGGLYMFMGGKTIHYTSNEGLVNNEVESLIEDKRGILYIGTRGGLSLLSKGKFSNYTTQDGLIDSYIYDIVEDNSGGLWLTGRTGISFIRKRDLGDFTAGNIERLEPVLYNESDGIKSPFCERGIKTRDGLWFATDKGVAMIDPSKIKKNPLSPPVILEELIVDGEAINISSLPASIPLVLPPGKRRLEFYYTGLSFVKSRQIKFKLKLEGYDENWVDVGYARSTIYTGLSPKKYTFIVRACNSDGVWNEKGASFSFYLKPYFYQTTWFYLFVVLFVLLAAFSFYRFRVGQLKARQKELGTLVELRTREVEDKNRQLQDQSEKLKEMDKIKSRFFANISHEFRTPLTLILGPLEQMIAACGEKEKETKWKLTLMLRNAQRLLRLINQLLELSKLDSGKMELQAVKTDMVSFIKGITASFQLLARQKELELVFHADAEAENIILYIDPRKMEDIMSNLLLNAVKFTPPGGEITITINKSFCGGPGGSFLEKSPLVAEGKTNSSAGFVEISVSDTGPGIPEEQLAHIFDRFYQADSTYESHEKGSGIGLALAKELVELHRGTIEATSREGEGTTFIIRLPDAPAPGKDTPALDKDVPALEIVMEEEENGSETEPGTGLDFDSETRTDEKNIILVVEDSADMRDYIRGALEPVYTVVDAEDGQQGIQKAQEIIPDLIISDIMMPGVDGYELCRVLKSDVQTSHVPIILLTAKASEENILQGLETGADDYVTKPFSTKILSARIKNLIDIRSQLQQNLNREMTLQPVKTSVSKIDREFLRDLQDVIKKNLSDPEFNVEELCKKLYMSNTTLYRKIQALCGQTPTEFIRSCRLKRAVQLLESGFGSVTEVAFEVGFSSRTYFTKCFKQRFHQLPSAYQETEKR